MLCTPYRSLNLEKGLTHVTRNGYRRREASPVDLSQRPSVAMAHKQLGYHEDARADQLHRRWETLSRISQSVSPCDARADQLHRRWEIQKSVVFLIPCGTQEQISYTGDGSVYRERSLLVTSRVTQEQISYTGDRRWPSALHSEPWDRRKSRSVAQETGAGLQRWIRTLSM